MDNKPLSFFSLFYSSHIWGRTPYLRLAGLHRMGRSLECVLLHHIEVIFRAITLREYDIQARHD
jgi:hypothetical protein